MRHIVVALVIALCSCKKAPRARAVQPPTVAEAETFGKEFAAKLAPCDAAAVDRMIDVDVLGSRAVAGQTAEFETGFKRGLGSLGGKLCEQLTAQDAKVTYLRTQQEAGVPRPLLRLISDAGVNYYQLELDKQRGTVRLADFYVFMSGENISATFASLIDSVGTASAASTAPKLKQIRQHMQAHRWEDAHAILTALPAKLRASKGIKLIEVQVTSELGDEAYLAALNDYTRAFPNDPSLALVSIDRALLREEYDTALKYMNDLDTRVGGDAYVDVLRSGTFELAGKSAEALAAAKRATEREPTLEDGWWQLLTLQASRKLYKDATASLEVLRDKFAAEVTTDTLVGDERFVELVESPEYAAWVAQK
jgi:hypothetical protein